MRMRFLLLAWSRNMMKFKFKMVIKKLANSTPLLIISKTNNNSPSWQIILRIFMSMRVQALKSIISHFITIKKRRIFSQRRWIWCIHSNNKIKTATLRSIRARLARILIQRGRQEGQLKRKEQYLRLITAKAVWEVANLTLEAIKISTSMECP